MKAFPNDVDKRKPGQTRKQADKESMAKLTKKKHVPSLGKSIPINKMTNSQRIEAIQHGLKHEPKKK